MRKHTLDSHLGYLHVDHSNSPGINATTARMLSLVSGKPVEAMPEGRIFERDTYKCPHCGMNFVKYPLRPKPKHYCRKCNAYLCGRAGCLIGCLPKEKIFDKAEQIAHRNPGLVMQAIEALRRDILGR